MQPWRAGHGPAYFVLFPDISVLRGMNLPPLGRDMLCASFPDGEKDACQVISIVVVSQLPSHVQLFVTLWTAAH